METVAVEEESVDVVTLDPIYSDSEDDEECLEYLPMVPDRDSKLTATVAERAEQIGASVPFALEETRMVLQATECSLRVLTAPQTP